MPQDTQDKTIFDDETVDHHSETTRLSVERPVLIRLDGADVNRRHRIDKYELFLGREISNDVCLADNKCSRRHVRLVYQNIEHTNQTPRILMQDLGSTNGVIVNGNRVTECVLNDRDKILVGSSLLGFFLRDQVELEADQRLYEMANLDALTGLRNRGVFNKEMLREFERARRYDRTLSLVLFDIDHFKKVNDTLGHQAGDYVLQEIGRLVKCNIRNNDIAARYGGEEFAIILPETNLEGAIIQAERMRMAVARHTFLKDQQNLSISISLGISYMEDDMTRHEEMIRLADQALYFSKDEGRDRTSWTRHGISQSNGSTKI